MSEPIKAPHPPNTTVDRCYARTERERAYKPAVVVYRRKEARLPTFGGRAVAAADARRKARKRERQAKKAGRR